MINLITSQSYKMIPHNTSHSCKNDASETCIISTMETEFSKRLKLWLKETGLRGAQSRLAEHCGVTPQTVQQWVAGKTKPEDDKYPMIADFFRKTEIEVRYWEKLVHTKSAIENPAEKIANNNPNSEQMTTIKLALIEYIQKVDDTKLSPEVLPILKEIIEAGHVQLPLIQSLVHAAWEQRAEYKVTENPSKRESNGK